MENIRTLFGDNPFKVLVKRGETFSEVPWTFFIQAKIFLEKIKI
jgi:hypothetical protein